MIKWNHLPTVRLSRNVRIPRVTLAILLSGAIRMLNIENPEDQAAASVHFRMEALGFRAYWERQIAYLLKCYQGWSDVGLADMDLIEDLGQKLSSVRDVISTTIGHILAKVDSVDDEESE